MKKRIFGAVLSVILSISILTGCMLPAAAEDDIMSMLLGILSGSDSSGSINVSEMLADMIKGEINEETFIDKVVNNLRNEFNGTGSTPAPDEDEDVFVELDPGAAESVVELFNISVNEIKKANPSFTKYTTAAMDRKASSSLQDNLGVVTGIVEALIGEKDIFAGMIDGTNAETNTITEEFEAGNDIINNISVSGKDYVSCLTPDDIYDYSVSIYSSGRYKIHIDLKDVEGSAASSGLSHVFNTTDKAFATIELGTNSINVNVKFKYTGCYVECSVDRHGNIQSYKTHMGITFLFQQPDGTYSSVMPYFNTDFEEEGIVYTISTEYTNFDFGLRLVGDANSDNAVNSTDARLVLRTAAKLEQMTDLAVKYCDIDGNGSLTPADARLILRAAAKLDILPTTEELIGIEQYVRDEAVQNNIDDLLVLLLAYQAADEQAKKEMQDAYDDIHKDDTTEEPTTGDINTPSNKVEDYVGTIGGIVGGLVNGDFSGLGNLFG